MNRTAIALLLAGALNGGCLPTNFVQPTGAADKKPAATETARKPVRPPVTAAQVTPANARDKAQELRDEVEGDLLSHIEAQDK